MLNKYVYQEQIYIFFYLKQFFEILKLLSMIQILECRYCKGKCHSCSVVFLIGIYRQSPVKSPDIKT